MLKKFAKWCGSRFWDVATGNTGAIITWAGSSGLMFYLGSITEWSRAFGPLGWALIAIISSSLAALGYWALTKAQTNNALRNFARDKIEARGVNVLAPTHNHELINLAEFYSPLFFPTENVSFTDCNLYGPALIWVSGGTTFHAGAFVDCEIVIARSDRNIFGATAFRSCHFLRGKIIRVTLLMTYEDYLSIPSEMRAKVRVISDGRIGDV